MQIGMLTLAMLCLNVVLAAAIFIGLLLLCRKRLGGSMIPFWAGCLSFFVGAMVLESIVHNLFLPTPAGQVVMNNIWLYALYGGLMAGLFEETARFVTMKLLRRKHDRPQTALIYGAGHGCIEVVLVMGLSMVNYIVYAVMLNAGQIDQLLAPLDETNRAAFMATLTSLAQTPPLMLLLSAMERISALILHIALSVLVWQAVTSSEKRYMYVLAIGLHALMDAAAVILSGIGVNTILLEALIMAFALGTAWYARRVYRSIVLTESGD